MIYCLFVILLCMTAIFFIVAKCDLISPLFIVPVTFTICVGFSALYTDIWNLPMHFNTCMVIICMILMFELGVFFSCWNLEKMHGVKDNTALIGFKLPWYFFITLFCIIICFLYLQYMELIRVSRPLTQSMNIWTISHAISVETLKHEVTYSRWWSYRMIFVKCISFFCLYAFIYNMINRINHWLYNLRFLAIALSFIPFMLITGGRQQFIYFAIFAVITTTFVFEKKFGKSLKNRMYIGGCACIFFLLFLSMFYLIGLYNGKIKESYTITRILAHYIGTNINALDYFINDMDIADSPWIGKMTLIEVYNKLAAMQTGVPAVRMYITQFVQFDGINTNVYTALRRYIQDYGYVGCGIVMFILGIIYSGIYYYLRNRYIHLGVIMYAFWCYPIFLLCREERFFTSLISTTSLYIFILMVLIYKLVPKTRKEIK